METVLTSLKEIKLKYIGSWLKDQLGRPDWFHNLVVDRSAWGAFSIYAHARKSDRKPKISYSSKAKAEKAAFDMSKRYGYPFAVYKCLFCEGWHVSKAAGKDSHGRTTADVALHKYTVKSVTGQDGLDVDKILATKIPDLAPVYGGFRGRTLSSARQHYAWRPFFIACVHGLHRTDIALCLYWVFYAADKGVAPPPICGYREDKGLDTHKIMRALDAMYNYMEKRDGKSPIPIYTFWERKEIIKKLSKM